jgi:hypothetical protein
VNWHIRPAKRFHKYSWPLVFKKANSLNKLLKLRSENQNVKITSLKKYANQFHRIMFNSVWTAALYFRPNRNRSNMFNASHCSGHFFKSKWFRSKRLFGPYRSTLIYCGCLNLQNRSAETLQMCLQNTSENTYQPKQWKCQSRKNSSSYNNADAPVSETDI